MIVMIMMVIMIMMLKTMVIPMVINTIIIIEFQDDKNDTDICGEGF